MPETVHSHAGRPRDSGVLPAWLPAMNAPATAPRRLPVITALGVVMIFSWGSSVYLIAAVSGPVVADTGWSLKAVMGAYSAALLAAGLVSPTVGRAIARHGGRPVLAMGCGLIAAGLAIMAIAPGLWGFFAGWLVVGLGMGAGLYDPAFATLGRIYGRDARSAITQLTLIGGFASTICWPLSTLFLDWFGWRGTALAYACIHLGLCIPLLLALVPRADPPPEAPVDAPRPQPAPRLAGAELAVFVLMACYLVSGGIVLVNMTTHLFAFLQAQGHSLAAAVALGALFGPAQVAARLLEMAGRGRHHPVWTLTISVAAVAAGLMLLAFGPGLAAAALILFGMGNGLYSIARGSLPLAVYGPERYPLLMGRLARPALIAQAAGPMIGAALIGWLGAQAALSVLALAALANVGIVWLLWIPVRRLRA